MNQPHQRTVVRQIQTGFVLIPVLGALMWLLLPDLSEHHRIRVVFGSIGLAVLPLAVGIQLMLFRRYNSPELIRGRTGSDPPSIREIYLSNTVEQALLAAAAILASGFVVPESFLKLPLVGAILFVTGRALYYWGYAKDPMRRFTGFVVGHYASLILLGTGFYFAVAGV